MDLLSRFEVDGYVIIPDFFPHQVIQGAVSAAEILVDRFAEKLKGDHIVTDLFNDEPFESRFARLCEKAPSEAAPSIFRKELHLTGLYDIFFHPPLLDHVEMILGQEMRLYPNYSIRPKLPDHAPTLVLWHQDGGYTYQAHLDGEHSEDSVEMLRMVNIWAPLVPATEENGCMQFIPGTHTLGMARHGRKQYYLEIDHEDLDPYLDRVVSIQLNPGDVALFHNMLYHQGLPNRSRQVRWSMDWRYQDATQSTLRKEHGHLARSKLHPDQVVKSPDHWARLSFG